MLCYLTEPTEGIQPSIIQDIGRAITYLRDKGKMAILLVEQYFEFARDLADDFVVMDEAKWCCRVQKPKWTTLVRRHLTV